MKIGIGDIVHIKNLTEGGYWKGEVTEIHKNGHEITVQDKGINFAILNVENLQFKENEYWEQ